MNTPFVAFGNGELDDRPLVKPGDTITCKRCGSEHELIAPDKSYTFVKGRKTLIEGANPTLLFYRCGDDALLAAFQGRLV